MPAHCGHFLWHHPPMTYRPARLLFLVLCGIARSHAQEAPQLDLPHTLLQAGMHQVDAQIAATAEQRAMGLMHRQDMPQHEGMLFVFERPATQCFWMKNTRLPLTAAFLAEDGAIVNLVDMKPQTTDSHCSARPVRFVLEMNQGWFARKGIRAGMKFTGRPFVAPGAP
jgi:uncharacterized protein